MSQTTNYQAFETFVFRTPFFSFQEFQNNLKLFKGRKTNNTKHLIYLCSFLF